MATLREITDMCKKGNVAEAYTVAMQDLEVQPNDVWKQRGMGWALYYSIKNDVTEGRKENVLTHLMELTELDMLSIDNDSMIFDNVIWKLAEVVNALDNNEMSILDRVFEMIRVYTFNPSKGYSYLLKSVMHHSEWQQLINFMEWWNLDRLLPEDYQQFQMQNGRKIISLAEQAYICHAKLLLLANDKVRIEAFLPKIENLMDNHPDMLYPGYFCGKLMIAMGADRQDTLKRLMPFVRKKQSEFWVWQLMSELYHEDDDMQTACLIRATHCNAKETFIGKVRMKLASLYIKARDYNRARHHIDCIVRCYLSQGWHIPYDVQDWLRQPWFNTSQADNTASHDFMKMTNALLCDDTNVSIAVVTYVDKMKKRVSLVYGIKQRTMVGFRQIGVRVSEGSLLRIFWIKENDGRINIVRSESAISGDINNWNYVRIINGIVKKRDDKSFAFVKKGEDSYFVSPNVTKRFNLCDGEAVSALAVYDYNNKKGEWTWNCVSVKK